MQLIQRTVLVAGFCVGACVPELGVAPEATITCDTNLDCPDDFECEEGLCRPLGPPRVSTLARRADGGRPYDRVTFEFRVADSDGDPVDVAPEWSVDGENWSSATAAQGDPEADPTTNLEPRLANEAAYIYVWNAVADLEAQLDVRDATDLAIADVVAATTVHFRLTPSDAEFTGTPTTVEPFDVGNDPPLVQLLETRGDRNDISVSLLLSDSSRDISDLELEFQIDDVVVAPPEADLSGWRSAAVGLGDTDLLGTSVQGTEYVLVWSSSSALAADPSVPQGMQGVTAGNVRLRARASDEVNAGTPHYGPWSPAITVGVVNNQTPPQISDVTVTRPQIAAGGGPVTIAYRLTDEQGDVADIDVEYSRDFGQSWQRAEEYRLAISEGRYDLASAPSQASGEGGLVHRFVWDATGIALVPELGAQLRLRASDGAAQSTVEIDLARPVGPALDDAFADSQRVHFGGMWGAAVVDINGDGRGDPIAGGAPSRVEVWLSTDTGFGELQTLASHEGAGDMAALDIDGDGATDLAVSNYVSGSITLYFADAVAGVFVPFPTSIPVCAGPTRLATGFFDGDSNVDLAVICAPAMAYQIWLGLGNGLFTFVGGGATSGTPYDIIAGQFTNDANLDLAIGGDQLVVLEGQGDGGFLAPVTILAQERGALAVVELDAVPDGLDDIAAGSFFGNDIIIVENNAGVFSTPYPEIPVLGAPVDLEAIDTDLDGISELAVLGAFDNSVTLLQASVSTGMEHRQTVRLEGDLVQAMTSGDLNGDGYVDVVAAHIVGPDLSILIQDPVSGLFEPPLPLSSFNPGGAVAADFNDDGVLDLAVTRVVSRDVLVRLGGNDGADNWDGTFENAVAYPAGVDANYIAGADFSGDGFVDLVVSSNSGPDIALFLGDGNGAFFPPTTFQIQSRGSAFVAADVNHDGRVDLVAGNTAAASATVLLATGTVPVFGAPTHVSTPTQPVGLAVDDWNGDGDPDLMVASADDKSVSFARGNGDGTFVAMAGRYTVGYRLRDVRGGDFNADGIRDMAASSEDAAGVWIFLGNDSGDDTALFEEPQPYGTGGQASNMAVADLNLDGVDDIMLALRFDDEVHVLVGNRVGGEATGEFASPAIYSELFFPVIEAPADFDRDGRLDLVTVNRISATVSIRLAAGDSGLTGALSELRSIAVEAGSPNSVAAVDLDADGSVDLVSGNRGSISFLYGAGESALGAFEVADVQSLGTFVGGVVVADFNGDLAQDVAIGVGDSVRVSLSGGLGSRSLVDQPSFASGGQWRAGMVGGDFTGDGEADLVALNQLSHNLVLHVGDGTGGFTPSAPVAGFRHPGTVFAHDLDRDGDLDLIVCGIDGGLLVPPDASPFEAWVVAGEPPGFGVPLSVNVPGAISATAADFDDDGMPDLAFATLSGELVTLRGLGDLGGDGVPDYDAPVTRFVGLELRGIVALDVNGDGVLDLVTADVASNHQVMLPGLGTGFFGPEVAIDTGSGVSAMITLDVNHDSVPDVLAANVFGGDLGAHFGQLPSARERRWSVAVRTASAEAPSVMAVGDLGAAGGVDRLGVARLGPVLGVHVARVAPGTAVVDFAADLFASGLVSGDDFTPLSAPWLATGAVRLTRVSGSVGDGGERLRVESRFGDAIESDPASANDVPGAGFGRTGWDLASASGSRGVIVRVPLRVTPGGGDTVRVFMRSRDWLRADEVEADPINGTAGAEHFLPRVLADAAYRDVVVETSEWWELPEHNSSDLTTATTPAWNIDGSTLEVVTNRLGVLQAFRVTP